jgi:hypothetical protein
MANSLILKHSITGYLKTQPISTIGYCALLTLNYDRKLFRNLGIN